MNPTRTLPPRAVPEDSYGVLQRVQAVTAEDEAVEQLNNAGYAVIDGGYSPVEMEALAQEFDAIRTAYIERHGEALLTRLGELHTVRSLLAQGGKTFRQLALNQNLIALIKRMIQGRFVLNQQNGIVNPPRQKYGQSAWHRDLPYQHFVSTRPLAINALFCVDPFSEKNGATFVLPGSHRNEAFPSAAYVQKNAVQIEAPAGSFIVIDCMAFHAGGFNQTGMPRRAVNHLFNIPYFKQQIAIPGNVDVAGISGEDRSILGFDDGLPLSVADYLAGQAARQR